MPNKEYYHCLLNKELGQKEVKKLLTDPSFFYCPEGMSPREHSQIIDQLIGFDYETTEGELSNQYRQYDSHGLDSSDELSKEHFIGTQAWIGLHPQILQTPYDEIIRFLSLLKEQRISKLVDIGSGYGRLGIVLKAMFPESEFIGYEIIPERVREAEKVFDKLGISDSQLIIENILEGEINLPKSDVYFIYDFSDPLDLKRLLEHLSERANKEEFFIVARGEGTRSMIQNKFPDLYLGNGAIHASNWSLYSTFCDLDSWQTPEA